MATSDTTATKFNLGSLCRALEPGSHCVVEVGPELTAPFLGFPSAGMAGMSHRASCGVASELPAGSWAAKCVGAAHPCSPWPAFSYPACMDIQLMS